MSAFAKSLRLSVALIALAATGAQAGGPIAVCNDAGKTPIAYNPTTVTLNYDLGNLGTRTKAQADALMVSSVALWTNVTTSNVVIARGADLPVDVTVGTLGTYLSSFNDGLNPVIYDTDGAIVDAIFGTGAKNNTLGFAGSAFFLTPNCRFAEGRAVISGFLTISDATMATTLAHEIGHLIGLDHTQLDDAQGLTPSFPSNYPLMYPIAYRDTADLHEDDVAAVTMLYPDANVSSNYGEITGMFQTADGMTAVLGANIWAKETTTNKLYSIVSDFRTQGNGYYRLLLPPGTYNLFAGAVRPAFDGGSSVGPYSEDWSGASFQPPLYAVGGVGGMSPVAPSGPMATVTLGGMTPTAILITAGCVATLNFRINGTGTVGGNCVTSGPPAAPTIGTATAGAGQVSVTFTPGSLNGGVLTHHHVTCAAATGPAFNNTGASSPIVVTGLTAGTAYRCWARTITNLGTSAWSGASNFATPTAVTGPPSAPVIGTATAGGGQVSVAFTPGSLNGGVLTHHHATCAAATGPAFNGYGASSPIVVAGLTSGTAYRCWVRTVTNLGTSPWSGASNFATPTNGPPAAPTIGMATAGGGQVSVAFTPGSLNGGVLTHHHATCAAATGPAFNGYGASSPIVVAGLTSGTAYRCWVRTVTNLGNGAWSMPSNFATPTNGPPAAPAIGMATAGGGQVSVAFTPGSLNGGVLTHHHATCAAATGPSLNGYGAASPIVVAGLTSGTAYRCWVRTVTNLGTGAWSGASNFATPTNGPAASPTMVMAMGGNGQASVSFTPGSLNGGVLTHHHATCAAATGPAFNNTGGSSPIVVMGLTNGTAYRCWVRTITNLGTGAWSMPSNFVTPSM